MKRTLVGWILPLLLASGAPPEPAVLTGRVTSPGGAPEAAVLVRIPALNVGAATGADGRYRLVVPAARLAGGGAVTVVASRTGLASVAASVALRPGETVTHDFVLAPAAIMLEGVVVGAVADAPRAERSLGSSVATVAPPGATVTMRGANTVVHPGGEGFDTEEYAPIRENGFLAAARTPLSTFAIDVDRASYSNVRRFLLGEGRLPPRDAVRIEEMVNYFPYAYPDPEGEHPFHVAAEVAEAPWNTRHHLVRIGIQGRRIDMDRLPPSNLVFLIDVSGSMMGPDRLPLVKQSLNLVVDRLRPEDRVAIVVYAGAAGLVLESTPGTRRDEIRAAIDRLEAGGSTAGGAGIRLAYDVARASFVRGGNNRVVLATDGDFNVGASSQAELVRLIEARREEGTFLTVLGYGRGNLADARMEQLADHGNGNYAYIDDLAEATKVLVREMGGTLFTIAKDVKLQVEFNPAHVHAYRLIGYENRLLAEEDFDDDRRDAGELGAGHSVTALYEVVPVGAAGSVALGSVDPLRYQRTSSEPAPEFGGELMNVRIRYKAPDGEESRLLTHAVELPRGSGTASADFRFAAAVAEFGMLLRGSDHRGHASLEGVLAAARSSLGDDEGGDRAAFVELAEAYGRLTARQAARD